jgi:hypothetical protein
VPSEGLAEIIPVEPDADNAAGGRTSKETITLVYQQIYAPLNDLD